MSLLKRIFPQTARELNPHTAIGDAQPDYVGLVTRIINGDVNAETELIDRFRDGVFQITLNIVRNAPLAEDLSQDALFTIIKKIRKGDVQQPERLKYFVLSVARFHAIGQIRRIRQRSFSENLKEAEQLPDPAPNQLDKLQASEERREIRVVIDELIPRYRELLFRFYVNEEPKEAICADLGLASTQFDGVLHRARNRYRELYLKGKGAADTRHGR